VLHAAGFYDVKAAIALTAELDIAQTNPGIEYDGNADLGRLVILAST
jgi:hypothetical protein